MLPDTLMHRIYRGLALLVALAPITTWADSKVPLNIPPGNAMDLLKSEDSVTRPTRPKKEGEADAPVANPHKKRTRIGRTCTDASGRIYTEGQNEYELCMNPTSKGALPSEGPRPGAGPGSGTSPGQVPDPAVGIQFKTH